MAENNNEVAKVADASGKDFINAPTAAISE